MSGSIGPEGVELTFPVRPRRRFWLVVAFAAAAAAATLAMVQGQVSSDPLVAEPLMERVAASSTEDVAPDEPAPQEAGSDERAADGRAADERAADGAADGSTDAATDVPLTRLLGAVDGLLLHAPADELVVVGFHEASSPSFPIEPIGRLLGNENTTRFEAIPDDPEGVDYHVMSSRGRIAPPTSAVDVVLEDGVAVLAPVSGIVADVREYDMYGRYLDHRVEIHPFDAPHLRVVLVHLAEVEVEVGDRVIAGVSVLAGTANRFPFTSQVDRETEPDRWPHVHLEVQPIDAPRPGDPVEPDDTSEVSSEE